jgi:hypothetical protein
MTVKNLRDLLKTISDLVELFPPADPTFKGQCRNAILALRDALGQAMGCAGDAVLYQMKGDQKLSETAMESVRKFKKWIAENYKFPSQ